MKNQLALGLLAMPFSSWLPLDSKDTFVVKITIPTIQTRERLNCNKNFTVFFKANLQFISK